MVLLSMVLVERMLDACHQVDRSIKGLAAQDPWLALERLTLDLCGLKARAA